MKDQVYDPVLGNNMRISEESGYLLSNIARWAKFLSILGFVMLGLMAIGILSAGTLISGMNRYMLMSASDTMYNPGVFSWLHALICLGLLVIYFFPMYFLFRFSTRIKQALASSNTAVLTEAFSYLQKHYMYIGILAIFGLIFFVLGIIFMFMGFSTYM